MSMHVSNVRGFSATQTEQVMDLVQRHQQFPALPKEDLRLAQQISAILGMDVNSEDVRSLVKNPEVALARLGEVAEKRQTEVKKSDVGKSVALSGGSRATQQGNVQNGPLGVRFWGQHRSSYDTAEQQPNKLLQRVEALAMTGLAGAAGVLLSAGRAPAMTPEAALQTGGTAPVVNVIPGVRAQAIQVRTAEDVVAQYRAGGHLYVQSSQPGVVEMATDYGTKRLNQAELDAIAQIAAENNFVVIITEDAPGGMTHWENTTGPGLLGNQEFMHGSNAVDARTGQAVRGVVLWSPGSREFNLIGAPGLDAAGLGESNMSVRDPFINAMQDGGRAVDGMRDMMTGIRTQYEGYIHRQIQGLQRDAQQIPARLEQDLAYLQKNNMLEGSQHGPLVQEMREASARVQQNLDSANPNLPAAQAEIQAMREATSAIRSQVAGSQAKSGTMKTVAIVGGVAAAIASALEILKAQKMRGQAQQMVDTWSKGIDANQTLKLDLEARTSFLQALKYDPSGETGKLVAKLDKQVLQLLDLNQVLFDRHQKAKGCLEGAMGAVSQVRHNPSAEAIRLLGDSVDKFADPVVLELVRDTGALEQGVDRFKPAEMSGEDLMELFGRVAKKVLGDVQSIEDAQNKTSSELANTGDRLTAITAAANKLTASSVADDWFALPSLTAIATQGSALVSQARQTLPSDPLTARNVIGKRAGEIADDGLKLATIATNARMQVIPDAATNKATLAGQGIKVDWVDPAISQLSQRAEELVKKAGKQAIPDEVQAFETRVNDFSQSMVVAVAVEKATRSTSPTQIKTANDTIATARKDLAALVGVSPDKVLVEPDRDPSTRTRNAQSILDGVRPKLDTGKVSEAADDIKSIKRLTDEATSLVTQTRNAQKEHATEKTKRENRTGELAPLVPTYKTRVADMQRDYADNVLGLGGDLGKAGEAFASASKAVEQNAKDILSAQKNYDSAAFLGARDTLDAVGKSHQRTDAIFKAIDARKAELETQVAANATALTSANSSYSAAKTACDRSETRSEAKSKLTEAKGLLDSAATLVGKKPNDPFASADALQKAARAIVSAKSKADADKTAHDEAVSAINTASSRVSDCSSWSSYGSGSTGSSDLRSARDALTRKDYEDAERYANSAKSDADDYIRDAKSAKDKADQKSSSSYSSGSGYGNRSSY